MSKCSCNWQHISFCAWASWNENHHSTWKTVSEQSPHFIRYLGNLAPNRKYVQFLLLYKTTRNVCLEWSKHCPASPKCKHSRDVLEPWSDYAGGLILSLPIPGRVCDTLLSMQEWHNPAICEMQTSVKVTAASDSPGKNVQEKMKLPEQNHRQSVLWAPGDERFHRAKGTATCLAVGWRRLKRSFFFPTYDLLLCLHFQAPSSLRH